MVLIIRKSHTRVIRKMTEKRDLGQSNIIDANNNLSFKVYRRLEGENNALFSPVNLHTLLSLLSEDLRYRNRNYNFESILCNYNDKDLHAKYYRQFQTFLQSKFNDGLLINNQLLLKDGQQLQNAFKDLINNFYYETAVADFNTTDTTVRNLNSWFAERTKGIIGSVISPDTAKEDTRVALLNSTHFNGTWSIPFTLEETPRTFHVNKNESLQIPMMKLTGELLCKFSDHNVVNTVELPLASDDFSILVILPNKGLVSQELLLESILRQEINTMDKKQVEVCLPKFEMEQLLNCKDLLSDIRLREEFRDDVNIFDMVESEEFLKYVQLHEKYFIKIDEKGVEAASGLGVTLEPSELVVEDTCNDGLKISEFNVETSISNRFAKTLVTSRVQNRSKLAKEATFTVVLPETAFITEFVMEINEKGYKSYIKGKEEAKTIYKEAVRVGKSAGIVEADTRNSNKFMVSVNLEAHSTAVFLLTYEEMLQRVHDQYELVLNICPGQIVDNINVEVNIKESRPLKFVKTPPIRSGQEIDPQIEKYLKPTSNINILNTNTSIVKFNADERYQRKVNCYLGTRISAGFSGQFVVQYDIERDPKDGEILLQDGYFVHFFAPNDLDPLPKHVVFVLDTSPSMEGRKIIQLKDAMMSILSEIRKGDLISIIEFNNNVIVWDITTEESTTIFSDGFTDFEEPFGVLSKLAISIATPADDLTINKAKNVVQKMCTSGATFMIGGLEVALYIVNKSQERMNEGSVKHQPIMVFLTDGIPNVGVGSSPAIVHLVTRLNSQHKVPIFSLSFGEGAEKAFLRELSLKNFGFSKHIYEAADASIQLQSFYKQISSPLLSDIKFKYQSDVTEVTRSQFPIYFKGGELVVSGRYTGLNVQTTINGYGPNGDIVLGSSINNPITSLERLWAYLTVKQLLEESKTLKENEEIIRKATDLALKYSFVTEVTSLVVVKPEEVCPTGRDLPEEEDLEDFEFSGNVEDTMAGIIKKRCCKKRVIKKRGNLKVDNSRIRTVDEDQECLEVEEEVPSEKQKRRSKPLKLIADHPFFIALTLKKGDRRIILFIGWVSKPSISKICN